MYECSVVINVALISLDGELAEDDREQEGGGEAGGSAGKVVLRRRVGVGVGRGAVGGAGVGAVGGACKGIPVGVDKPSFSTSLLIIR